MLNEKIEESGKNLPPLINPEGSKFEFEVAQIVIPAEFINQELEDGYDPDTLELLYSVSDSN